MLQGRLKSVVFALIMLVLGLLLGMFIKTTDKTKTAKTADNTDTQTTVSSQPEPVLTVEAIRPAADTATTSVQASGAIVGHKMALVGTKISGVAIERVLVEEGEAVKKGQVLAVLDPSQGNNGLLEAEAGVVQATANLKKVTSDLARVTPLIKIDAISREQYESYQNAEIQAKSQLQMAKARLNNAKTSLYNTQVLAPVSGVISTKTAQVGMMTNGSVLFEIIENGVLEWQASVTPNVASQIGIGQAGEIFVNTTKVPVQVTRISPIANDARQLIVHAIIADNPYLRSGMYQSGQFLLSSQPALSLPQKVLTMSDGRAYVWVLTKQGEHYRANKQTITLGQLLGDKVVVELPADTLVVKEGGNFLKEGDIVRLANSN